MADTKITALTALTAADPANDVIPIVDVSDTTMAASGTTKKISVNNILGASGTATLASATITGDLTVDTSTLKVDSANNRVGIGTASPTATLHVSSAGSVHTNQRTGGNGCFTQYVDPVSSNYVGTDSGNFRVANNSAQDLLNIQQLGVFSFGDGAGGTRMTLNSTGLGVGGSPATKIFANVTPPGAGQDGMRVSDGTRLIQMSISGSTYSYQGIGANQNVIYASGNPLSILSDAQNLRLGTSASSYLLLDTSGNVGIGVTPSAWGTYKGLQVGYASLAGYAGSDTFLGSNVYFDGGAFRYISTATASNYRQLSGVHQWNIAPSGTAGNSITFTQAMTLDASGNLLVGTTSNTNLSRVFSRGTATSSALALQGASGDVALAQLTVGKFDNNTTTSQIFVRFTINDNSGGSGQINANGASQAAFGTFSDSRLKKNIVSLPSQLANILSLRPVEFDYKDGSGHQIGFVAQEMQEVYSDAVGEQNGFLTVTGWSKTEARLVSAIKELAAKVQALEAKLA